MSKCDFCTQSLPKGKCLKDGYLENPMREYYCKKTIERMIEALQTKQRKE